METLQMLDELSAKYKIEITNEGVFICLLLTDFYGIQSIFRNYLLNRCIERAYNDLIYNESKLDVIRKNKPKKLR